MINFNNHNNDITEIHYNNHSIKYVYGCGGNLVWSGETTPHDYSSDYLTFIPLEDTYFSFSQAINYSTDSGTTWNTLPAMTDSSTFHSGDTIIWKGNFISSPYQDGGIGHFKSSGRINVQGNIMSLVYGDNFIGQTTIFDKCFRTLFGSSNSANDSIKIVSAENLILPAMNLTYGCYANMFMNSHNLEKAPKLLATTLATACYSSMFYKCENLTTAPDLLATTLATACYNSMFYLCDSLNYVKCLATNSASEATSYWLDGVSGNGTFVKNSAMSSWTRGEHGIPYGWTVQDA